jgi:hypothetical protein
VVCSGPCYAGRRSSGGDFSGPHCRRSFRVATATLWARCLAAATDGEAELARLSAAGVSAGRRIKRALSDCTNSSRPPSGSGPFLPCLRSPPPYG